MLGPLEEKQTGPEVVVNFMRILQQRVSLEQGRQLVRAAPKDQPLVISLMNSILGLAVYHMYQAVSRPAKIYPMVANESMLTWMCLIRHPQRGIK
jgi:hypothetical protein